jgi:hypothetical protein
MRGRVNPHAFRHAFAREHILNGGDLGPVSEMMGHTQIAVPKLFYAVFQADELRAWHEAYCPVSRLPCGRMAEGHEHVTVRHHVMMWEERARQEAGM